MTKPNKRAAASRGALVRAASDVIRLKGLEGLRVREVATAAQMSPGSVLYHYPANEDLVLDVHRGAVEEYLAERRRVLSDFRDPSEALIALIRAGVPPFADEGVIRLLFELQALAARDQRHAQLMTSLWTEEKDLYVTAIANGIAAGAFSIERPIGDVAAAILAAEDGLALHVVSNNSAISGERAVELVRQVAMSLLNCASLGDTTIIQ